METNLFKEFCENRSNRSNNKGKINYIRLSELAGTDFHKNPNFVKFSSKSDEKKSLRGKWQKMQREFAERCNELTDAQVKEFYKLVCDVQGAPKTWKDLYNAKSFEVEENMKKLFSRMQKVNSTTETKKTK